MPIIILHIRGVTIVQYTNTETPPAVIILHCTVKAILFAIPNIYDCGKKM